MAQVATQLGNSLGIGDFASFRDSKFMKHVLEIFELVRGGDHHKESFKLDTLIMETPSPSYATTNGRFLILEACPQTAFIYTSRSNRP